jgi:hypothetical protein
MKAHIIIDATANCDIAKRSTQGQQWDAYQKHFISDERLFTSDESIH